MLIDEMNAAFENDKNDAEMKKFKSVYKLICERDDNFIEVFRHRINEGYEPCSNLTTVNSISKHDGCMYIYHSILMSNLKMKNRDNETNKGIMFSTFKTVAPIVLSFEKINYDYFKTRLTAEDALKIALYVVLDIHFTTTQEKLLFLKKTTPKNIKTLITEENGNKN
jgi:hypothetical protein